MPVLSVEVFVSQKLAGRQCRMEATMIEHPVNHLQQCVQEYVGGEFKGMSSRSVDIALNEAFEKHVDPWLDVLKTSYDG